MPKGVGKREKVSPLPSQNAYAYKQQDQPDQNAYAHKQQDLQSWFAQHVTLEGEPYFLDADQTCAVTDSHQNTLVTARAGSGKTRVIVAKVAYLVAWQGLKLDEIAVFMFNRTAAAEVNQRIASVKIDGRPLAAGSVTVASTFHKYALDILKNAHQSPQIISETVQNTLIQQLFHAEVAASKRKYSPQQRETMLRLVHTFIARAGQKYPGVAGLKELQQDVKEYVETHHDSPEYQTWISLHEIALAVYLQYHQALSSNQIDFNILMAQAAELLRRPELRANFTHITKLRQIMIDEYQDFSYLFLNLTNAIRELCPAAKLFAVGDDWQAINRFAGSDCAYFLEFAKYFPVDQININLTTNYRSCRKIVENANRYMLTNYDPVAVGAVAKNSKAGKIHHLNPSKLKFNHQDYQEDALGDGRFQLALAEACHLAPSKVPVLAMQYLKQLYQLCRKHHKSSIMLLHRHNFTSFANIGLPSLQQALFQVLENDQILSATACTAQIRCMTMHKSKGLEADVVIILEANHEQVLNSHPHATIFEIFGDTLAAERADQQRLLYVAMTRAKKRLYVLSTDKNPPI